MTFTAIVASVGERLNLTSPDALARIGRNVNDRYVRLTSSVGLQTSRRGSNSQNTIAANPRVTFALEKLENIHCVDAGKRRVLDQRTYDEWRNQDTVIPLSGDPMWYAIEETGAASVTVVLYPTPSSVMALVADGLENAAVLAGTDVPAFPADYHNALVFGAMADEYTKLDKPDIAARFEAQFEQRIGELRLFIAKSSYLSIHQGPRQQRIGPYRRTYLVS